MPKKISAAKPKKEKKVTTGSAKQELTGEYGIALVLHDRSFTCSSDSIAKALSDLPKEKVFPKGYSMLTITKRGGNPFTIKLAPIQVRRLFNNKIYPLLVEKRARIALG